MKTITRQLLFLFIGLLLMVVLGRYTLKVYHDIYLKRLMRAEQVFPTKDEFVSLSNNNVNEYENVKQLFKDYLATGGKYYPQVRAVLLNPAFPLPLSTKSPDMAPSISLAGIDYVCKQSTDCFKKDAQIQALVPVLKYALNHNLQVAQLQRHDKIALAGEIKFATMNYIHILGRLREKTSETILMSSLNFSDLDIQLSALEALLLIDPYRSQLCILLSQIKAIYVALEQDTNKGKGVNEYSKKYAIDLVSVFDPDAESFLNKVASTSCDSAIRLYAIRKIAYPQRSCRNGSIVKISDKSKRAAARKLLDLIGDNNFINDDAQFLGLMRQLADYYDSEYEKKKLREWGCVNPEHASQICLRYDRLEQKAAWRLK